MNNKHWLIPTNDLHKELKIKVADIQRLFTVSHKHKQAKNLSITFIKKKQFGNIDIG